MVVSRREFISLGAGALAAGALGTGLHEPFEIAITQREIKLKRLAPAFENFRIAQLSDIHFDSHALHDHLVRVVEATNAQKPDLVVLTGDYVTATDNPARTGAEKAYPCADVLRKLDAPFGCFAVLGNHDHGSSPEIVTQALNETGRIQVLRNRSLPFERDNARLWLAGVDDVTWWRARPEVALAGVPNDECTIVAVHEPDYALEIARYPVDLQLSGHSHGGQVRFPLVGGLYFPPLGRKYPRGHYKIGHLQLYTNCGIGVIGIPIRLMCPPEIAVFTLKTA